eukprot:TRINITY_DN72959_c0_g1_i1.p1 TRINITY_DN72959_c0_g1~~TRINITY_DN72959_c0_g1_i1.p1  ORF type:complete len:765 (-),score=167.98 TRINITY_DN72959_c0_g1_i1:296-2590(-)
MQHGAGRPGSASRRKGGGGSLALPPGHGGSFVGGGQAAAASASSWLKDRGRGIGPVPGAHQGLSRQASAPSLGLHGSGLGPGAAGVGLGAGYSFDVGRGGGFDTSFSSGAGASSMVAGYGHSPGMRRASSTGAVAHGHRQSHGHASGSSYGSHGGLPGSRGSGGGSYAASMAGVPRRRPYDSSPVRSGLGERADIYGGGPPPRPGSGGMMPQQRTDALQLESRLTELLREHSLPYTSHGHHDAGMRRPGTADGRSRDALGAFKYGPGSGFGAPAPSLPTDSRYSTPGQSLHDRRTGSSPAPYGGPGGHGPHGRSPLYDRRTPNHYEATHGGFSGGSRRGGPPLGASESYLAGLEDASLPESRLKIYSDLFEEVIERDRVFGTLLRKIKTAYDTLLLQKGPDFRSVPPMPDMGGVGGPPGQRHDYGGGGAGPLSTEPTARTEAWEMQRENRVLKDLVERLHLELEEAVRREQRWKQKAVKLKARSTDGNSILGKVHGGLESSYNQNGSTLHLGHSQTLDVAAAQAAYAAGQAAAHEPPPPPNHHYMAAQATQLPPFPELNLTGHDGHKLALDANGGLMAAAAGSDLSPPAKLAAGGAPPRSFHAGLREPSSAEPSSEQALNQGGLLSMSSISAMTSPQHALQASELREIAEDDSARSVDSGRLPQRPERRQVIRPSHVPALDLRAVWQHVEDDEGEEMMDDDPEGMEDQHYLPHGYDEEADAEVAAVTYGLQHGMHCYQARAQTHHDEDDEDDDEYGDGSDGIDT